MSNRKWKVTVKANVTAPIERSLMFSNPEIDDAVRLAVETVADPYGKGEFNIVSVQVEPVISEDV